MSRNIEMLQQLLEKLKLKQAIPDEIKEFVLDAKPVSLISTLKFYGEYSFVYRYILKTYYLLGRSGMGVTIAQSKIIAGLAALVLGASISTSAALSYKYITTGFTGTETEETHKEIIPGKQTEFQEQAVMENHEAGAAEEEIKPKQDIKSPGKKKSSSAGKTKELKKLSVVVTKDGKTYTGSFRAVGKNVEVITEEGKIIIPSENVKNISPYKGAP